MEAIRFLYDQIVDLELKPNFVTFAILLQCHGRQETLAVDAVKKVLKDVAHAVSICVVLAFATVVMLMLCNCQCFVIDES